MGSYEAEWYGFEVESKRHLMDLLIEPSFSPAICSQFHEMADGSYKVYYNFQPRWKEVTDALKAYARQQNMDPSMLEQFPSSLDLFLGTHPGGAGAMGEICARPQMNI